ncbi:hypothetical protein ACFV83_30810 [Streptomyces pharetrae]|uniref:hypothetical protein n=1 Tax=Streptomyces pharetrae TaxID=291370 RepID=UPI003654BD97
MRVPFKAVAAATRGSAVGTWTWPARNDRQPNPHRGDAWVDDKRAGFKAMKSRRADGLKDHLKKADVHQQVELAVMDLRPGGMEEDY